MTHQPNLLVIDTARSRCSVGVLLEGQWNKAVSDLPRQAAQQALPMIQSLLDSNGKQLRDIHAIAIATGPGSFTGLRIGIGIAQGLSESIGLPVVPVSTLALAAYAQLSQSTAQSGIVALAARDDERYLASYRKDEIKGVVLESREAQLGRSAVVKLLEEVSAVSQYIAIGDAWDDLKPELDQAGIELIVSKPGELSSLEQLKQLALLYFEAGVCINGHELQPNYVKEQMNYSN